MATTQIKPSYEDPRSLPPLTPYYDERSPRSRILSYLTPEAIKATLLARAEDKCDRKSSKPIIMDLPVQFQFASMQA